MHKIKLFLLLSSKFSSIRKFRGEVEIFSPLEDEAIPDDVDALIFGGGFPEVFAQELMQNTSMIKSIRKANERKMPIYAECGGFMYLMQEFMILSKDFMKWWELFLQKLK